MKFFSECDLSDPDLLMMLQVLLAGRTATGADILVEGEQVDEATVLRVIDRSSNPKLALICDHLIPPVPEPDREKYEELFIKLIARLTPGDDALGVESV
ncbi:MAG: hypothetical protein KGL39_53575 [Patescibacteria group bacterium]|nr:hypothetical protein [Patescibacteria group bacterium]